MAGAVVEAVPAHGEDLQKRIPIPPRSCSAQVTSPHITLPVVKASTARLQCIGSELVPECLTGLTRTEKPFLAPRPSWPITLKSLPHIDSQDPENHRNRLAVLSAFSFYSCPYGTGPSTAATPESTSTGLRQSSKAYGRHARGNGKRERQQQNDSESDDVSETPEKSSRKKICDTSGSTHRLACPFFMCRPNKHLRCGFSSFGRISHVAQHLARQHYESVKCDCPICGINFDTLSSRTAHLREQRCLRRSPRLCAVTTERLEEIKSVSTNRLKTQYEKWVDIYKIIVGDSMPAPLPWCTDPLGYLLRHFISFVSRSGGHSIFDAVEDPEAQSQTLSNYLADEQEPLESLSILQSSLQDSNFVEFSAQHSISYLPDTSIAPSQLDRVTMSMPVSTVPGSHEVTNMTGLEVTSNQPHELVFHDIISNSELEEISAGFLNFFEHEGGSLT
ncbi:hypothetical protein F4782DRAFT_531155 [Xylaria castorea]|nr:hypothetical protein F4782DRAFT_531155 [Xylaria castorea]